VALNPSNNTFDAVGVSIHSLGISVSSQRVFCLLAIRSNSPRTSHNLLRQLLTSLTLTGLRNGSKIAVEVAIFPQNSQGFYIFWGNGSGGKVNINFAHFGSDITTNINSAYW